MKVVSIYFFLYIFQITNQINKYNDNTNDNIVIA